MSSLKRSSRGLACWSFGVAILLAAPQAASAQSNDIPKPAVDLKPGTSNYRTRLEIDGQVVPMELTHTVKAQGGTWIVTDELRFANYTAIDSGIIERKTLVSRSRTFHDLPPARPFHWLLRTNGVSSLPTT